MSVGTLVEMHSYMRPAGSAVEREFCTRYIAGLPGAYRDVFGNWHVKVTEDPILWSSHTDTVHRVQGMQRIKVGADGMMRLHRKSKRVSSCLGADDTVGVYLLTEMIKAGMPGYYLFHFGEEQGCKGSRDIAEDYSEWLQRFDAAIAFDRAGKADIITHQCGQRTASDTFARSLAEQLNGSGMRYVPCDRGLFTDTESYAEIIPECTNVSIGYENAHSGQECVDTNHVMRLRDRVVDIDIRELVIARDPSVREMVTRKVWTFKHGGMTAAQVNKECVSYREYLDRDEWPDDPRDDPDDPDGWLSMERAEVERELRAIESRERSMIAKRYQDVH